MKNILLFVALAGTPIVLTGQNSAFDDLIQEGNVFSNWIGSFTFQTDLVDGNAFIDHAEHGVLYLDTAGQDVWLYDFNIASIDGLSGWIYTSRDVYPFFFVDQLASEWLYYIDGVPGPRETSRIFADFVTGGSILLPRFTTQNIAEIAVGAGVFETLVTALGAADLATTIATGGPFTVFAPTDTAFGAIDEAVLTALVTDDIETLTEILLYHVVSGIYTSDDLYFDPMGPFRGQQIDYFLTTLGGSDLLVQVTPFGLTINGSTSVITADVRASNGVIHIVDEVIMPPATIVGVADAAGFSTLLELAAAADLAGVLSGEGPFTVFAPTNEAFAALDAATVEFLLSEEGKETLVGILLYHVVEGKVYASEVPVGDSVATVNGALVDFTSANGGIQVGGANIVATNVRASNGVIHVIDKVILPPEEVEPTTTFAIGFDGGAFNYTINSEIGAGITMQRGTTYTFSRSDFGGHPFTLATVAPGTAFNESQRYGSSPNLTSAGETIIYTPGASTPDTLFYRCTVHASMGGTITVID